MKFFLILSFLAFNLKAQYLDKGVIDFLEKVNDDLIPKKHCSLYILAGQKNPIEKDYQNCVKSVCGDPIDNKTSIVTNTDFEKKLSSEKLKNLKGSEKVIKQVIEESIKRKRAQLNDLKKIMQNGKLDISKYDNLTKYKVFNSAFNEVATVNFNLKSPPSNRVFFKYNFPDWADENFKNIMIQMGESYLKSFKNPGHSFFSENEVKEIYLERLDQAYAKADDQLKAKIIEEKNKLANKKKISFTEATSIRLLLENVEGDRIKTPGYYASCESTECQNALNRYLKNEISNKEIDNNLELINDQSYLENKINSCKAGLFYKYIKSEKENDSQKRIEQAIKAINQKIIPLFSAHSQEILKTNIEKIKFKNSFPLEYMPKMSVDFNAQARTYLKDNSRSNNPDQLIADWISLRSGESLKGLEENPCERFIASSAWDATISSKNEVFVSDYTCTHETRGPQIIAHEMGHFINYVFRTAANMSTESMEKYLKMRSCVASNFPREQLISDEKFTSDRVTTEEDMADYFAHIAFPEATDLFSCGLMVPDDKNQNYKNLSIDKMELSAHSNSFTRLLMEINRKKIPVPISCQKIMDTAEGKLRFNTCLNI